jgi:hypothetical protein
MGENTKDSPTAPGFPEPERLRVFENVKRNSNSEREDLKQKEGDPNGLGPARAEAEVVL